MSQFGDEFNIIWPSPSAPLPAVSEYGKKLLEQCKHIEKPQHETVNIQAFIKKSSDFPLPFGVETCRVVNQPKQRHNHINQQISSVYPLIHERTLLLYLQYLEHKSTWGTPIECNVYNQLTLCDFIQRLLSKRCASFFARNDKYLLLSGERGASGFEPIGSMEEKTPLQLQNVLSYDDIKLSALLSVSSHTEFINNGTRDNCGIVERNKKLIETDGVIIGLIGARLSRRNLMEFQDIVIAKSQNTKLNGYGYGDGNGDVKTRSTDYRRIWKQFYESRDYLYNEYNIINGKRFGKSGNKLDIFDNVIMKRRYSIAFDMLLFESEERAKVADKLAYIHVVGFGLGVWRVAPQQEEIFLAAFEERLRVHSDKLKHIGFVHFSWFKMEQCGSLFNGAQLGNIKIKISKRNPADKISPSNMTSNMLLIVSYAWDGNALPGNEFWMKMLKSTGDSSTACSTLITELHNPHINTRYCCGNNLHIVSPNYGGVLHISDYVKKFYADNIANNLPCL